MKDHLLSRVEKLEKQVEDLQRYLGRLPSKYKEPTMEEWIDSVIDYYKKKSPV